MTRRGLKTGNGFVEVEVTQCICWGNAFEESMQKILVTIVEWNDCLYITICNHSIQFCKHNFSCQCFLRNLFFEWS